MKYFKNVVLSVIVAVMLLSMAACQDSSPSETALPSPDKEISKLDEIKAAGRLVVGTSADYPPYEFHAEIDGKDTIVGFDMALAKYFADSIGVELEIVDMGFDSLLISLQEGKFDLVLAGLSATEERKKVVDFTDEFFINRQIVIIRKEDAEKYTNTDSFKGLKLGVQSGSTQEEIAATLTDEANVIKLPKCQDIMIQLKAGKIEGFCTNNMVATAYVSGNDDLLVQDVGLESGNAGFAAAVQKGNDEFVQYLNTLVAQVKADGTMDRYIKEAQELAGEQ